MYTSSYPSVVSAQVPIFLTVYQAVTLPFQTSHVTSITRTQWSAASCVFVGYLWTFVDQVDFFSFSTRVVPTIGTSSPDHGKVQVDYALLVDSNTFSSFARFVDDHATLRPVSVTTWLAFFVFVVVYSYVHCVVFLIGKGTVPFLRWTKRWARGSVSN